MSNVININILNKTISIKVIFHNGRSYNYKFTIYKASAFSIQNDKL